VTNFSVNGDPLRDDETYTLATNDYVFDNWAGFADATLLETTEDFLGTVFIEHLRRDGVVEPDVDNHLLRVDEDVGVADVERGEGTATVVTDRPATAERVYGETFKAMTAYGHEIEAQSAEERGESVAVTFDYEDLSMLASGPKNPIYGCSAGSIPTRRPTTTGRTTGACGSSRWLCRSTTSR